MEDNGLLYLLLAWMIAIILVAVARWRRAQMGTGLTLAYLLNFWLIHWLAVSLYLIPGYQNNDLRIMRLGFEQSVYGVFSFAFGAVILTPFILNLGLTPRPVAQTPDERLPKAYIGIGIVAFLSLSVAGSLPSLTALVATGQELVVVGLGLCCWQAWRQKNYGQLTGWMTVTLMLPFITIVTRGFIGYGAIATLTVLIFVSGFIRSRFLVAIAGIIVVYMGLSFYVTYMRDRGEIRDVVWGGQSLTDRVGRLAQTVETFEWFDPANDDHLYRIDDRMNQNVLVGAAVSRLSDIGGYANGSTIWGALLALVPRLLWPDKPFQAGSGNLVSEYTGITYAVGTSIGIGQVMEFYINFGTLGVIIGFTVMGVAVTMLDALAAERLACGDLHGFVLFFLPGLALLQVGGALDEITSSAGASLIMAFLANKYLDRLQKKQALRAEPPSSTLVRARHA